MFDNLIEYPFYFFYVCNLSDLCLNENKIDLPEYLFDFDDIFK